MCSAIGFSDKYRCNVSQCFFIVFSSTSGSTPGSSIVYSVVAKVRNERTVAENKSGDGWEKPADRRNRKLAERNAIIPLVIPDNISMVKLDAAGRVSMDS